MCVGRFIDEYRSAKQGLDWLDAHCWVGVPSQDPLPPVETLDACREALARFGVRRAVLAHAAAKEYDPSTGNRLLLEAVAGDDRFWAAAVWSGDPLPDGECRRRLASLVERKVRMIRVFPKSHNFLLAEWCAGPWLSVLEEMRLPLAVGHTETTWEEVAEVCRRHPRLPVIVEGPVRKLLYHNRVFYRLLEVFENFHLEIHNLVGYLGLDDLVRWFSSGRLLFGTYFPYQDPNASMMLVTHGEMEQADRENIAFRNMERLMAGVGVR